MMAEFWCQVGRLIIIFLSRVNDANRERSIGLTMKRYLRRSIECYKDTSEA
jgi:hypothetical protein